MSISIEKAILNLDYYVILQKYYVKDLDEILRKVPWPLHAHVSFEK
jgi:hypothetical protein